MGQNQKKHYLVGKKINITNRMLCLDKEVYIQLTVTRILYEFYYGKQERHHNKKLYRIRFAISSFSLLLLLGHLHPG